MRYSNLYILCFLILFANCKKDEISEDQAKVFYKLFGNNTENIGYDIEQTPDGGYIFIGKTTVGGGGIIADHTDMIAVKADKYGNYLWTKTFGDSLDDYGKSILVLPEGGYLLLGTYSTAEDSTDLFLIKIDENGNELLNKIIEHKGSEEGNCAVMASNNQIIIAGSISDVKTTALQNKFPLYVMIDSTLDTLRTSRENTPGELNYITKADNNTYLCIGTYRLGSQPYSILAKTINEDLESTNLYSDMGTSAEYGTSAEILPDGSVFILGYTGNSGKEDILLIKINHYSDLNNIARKDTIGENAFSDIGTDIILTSDNNLLISGYSNTENPDIYKHSFSDGNYNTYITKISIDGDLLWQVAYGYYEDQIANAVIESSDGGFVLTGVNSVDINNSLIYLMKTTPEGTFVFEE